MERCRLEQPHAFLELLGYVCSRQHVLPQLPSASLLLKYFSEQFPVFGLE